MRISILTFGAIASVLALNAFAETTTSTIPTQNYVDNKFQEKIPAGADGANGSVVTYGGTAGDVQERFIMESDNSRVETAIKFGLVTGVDFSGDGGLRLQTQLNKTGEELDQSLVPAKYISYALGQKQATITPGTTGSVVTYNGTISSSNGSAAFSERAIYDGSTTYDSTTDTDKLVTAGVVDTKQNKMTCTQWLGDEHTDANCLLWSIN
ncbi:MAG: hypothetical protein J5620_00955 [Alphaproteobacteria bacterium]|nr:hypothetical protein [Alphaproteobacteria bacterium]